MHGVARPSLAVVPILVLALSCGGAPAAGTTASSGERAYAIRLHRPTHLGDASRDHVEVTDGQSVKVVVGSQVVSDRTTNVVARFDGTVRVTAVDDAGRAARLTIVVDALTSDGGSGATVVLPPGTQLEVTCGVGATPTVYATAAGPVDDATRAVLDLVVDAHHTATTVTDDDLFGTAAPQPVGARWPVNAEALRRSLSQEFGVVASVSGTAALERAAPCSAGECLDVSAVVHLSGVQPSGLPAGTTIQHGELDMRFETTVPVDTTRHHTADRQQMSSTIAGTIDVQGQPGALTVTAHRDRSWRSEALRP